MIKKRLDFRQKLLTKCRPFLEVLVGIIIVDFAFGTRSSNYFPNLFKPFTSEPLSGQNSLLSNQAVNDPINYYFKYINNIYDKHRNTF